MDKKQMLENIIDHYTNGNKAKFANILGVSPQTISAWVSRNTFDSELIYTKCSDISANWLLTGKGDMLKNNSVNNSTSIEEDIPEGRTIDMGTSSHDIKYNSNDEGIPLIPLSAMAGVFTGDVSIMEYECERYVIPAFKGADFLIQVKGDSMQPTYNSGDLVACERVPLNDIFFQWNKTYVLDTKQGPLIKRIMPGSDSEHVLIVSDNEKYPSFELSKDQFYGVALVRGIVRLE